MYRLYALLDVRRWEDVHRQTPGSAGTRSHSTRSSWCAGGGVGLSTAAHGLSFLAELESKEVTGWNNFCIC